MTIENPIKRERRFRCTLVCNGDGVNANVEGFGSTKARAQTAAFAAASERFGGKRFYAGAMIYEKARATPRGTVQWVEA